jgi:hypothetical protein
MTKGAVLGMAVVFLGLPACLYYLFLRRPVKKWRLNKRIQRLTQDPLPTPYRIAYTATVQDLLDAHTADMNFKDGFGFLFRLILVLFGIFWACGPIWIFVFKLTEFNIHRLITWLCGCGIVLGFLVRPWIERAKIRKTNPLPADVSLKFDETGITIENSIVGEFHRSWNEVKNTTLCSKGLLIYFTDGICNLLPKRIFPQKKDSLKLHAFIHKSITENKIYER